MSLAALFADVGEQHVHADVAYQHDPIRWMVEVMGIPEHTLRWSALPEYANHTWDGTPDPLVLICESLAAGKDVAVESATGTGKTFLGALLVQWFTACFEDSITVTTAPKEQQLSLHLWKELGATFHRFRARYPSAELVDLKLRMKPGTDEKEKWAAVGFACGVDAGSTSATRAQGFHAEHLLILTEETPGIKPAVLTAFENTLTGDHNLQINFGNPDHQLDALHLRATSPGVVPVRISALDHPNVVTGRTVVPGAVSRKSIERRRVKYGEDSRIYQSRVLGISPAEAADALIKLEWCRSAAARYNDPALRAGLPALGVDPANSEHGDPAGLARGIGACLLEVRATPCPDALVFGVEVAAVMAREGISPRHVGVDSVGVGAATVNKLRELKAQVAALNGGAAAVPTLDEDGERPVLEEERFANLRAQMHWYMRRDLERGLIALPNDEELFQDLITPTWWTHNGKIWVEAKEDIKERLPDRRSPNKGDAAVYWNWVRRRRPVVTDPPEPRAFAPETLAREAVSSRKVLLKRKAQSGRRKLIDPHFGGMY